MSNWLVDKLIPSIMRSEVKKSTVPEGLWHKCPSCDTVLYRPELEKTLDVCPKCDHHMRINARTRLNFFLDPEGREEIAAEPLSAEAELLLVFAARAQHVRQVIQPALQRGAYVLSDRFTDSSYAYQGGGRGLDPHWIAELERRAVGLLPGLTLLLDVDVSVGRARANGRDLWPDRIESEQDDFFQRVREVFRSRARQDPQRFAVIDAGQERQQVAADVVSRVERWLQQEQGA